MKTRKKVITAVIMAIIPFIVLYLIWAFVHMNMNPYAWSMGSRSVYVLWSVVFSVIALSWVILNKE